MTDLDKRTKLKEEFLKWILEIDEKEKKENHFNVMTKDIYNRLLDEVEEAQLPGKKTQKQYRRLSRFKVIDINGTKKLVTRKEPVRHYACVDEIFDIIEASHLAVKHRGRDKVKTEAKKKYANITVEMINIFLSMCETCTSKRNKKEMNSRCQVDLIDMEKQEDQGYKYIMSYQDHQTKFIVLRPLKSKMAVEVARQLVDIFSTFGAPYILQSNCGKEFVDSVTNELFLVWPQCKMVQGVISSNKSHKSVGPDNHDIKKMVDKWMHDNYSIDWSNGLPFIQFKINSRLHSGIKQSPYQAIFGIEPQVESIDSRLPLNTIKMETEDDDLDETSDVIIM